MKKLILLLTCALSISSLAQTDVAVYVTGLDSTQSATMRIIGSELATGIVAKSDYNAVDRTEEFFKVLKENGAIGSISDQKIMDLGKQYGAKHVCFVNIMPYQNTFYIQAKFQNANNAKILSSVRESSSLESLEEILRATESLSTNLINQLNAKREEVRQKELEKERIEQQKAQQRQQEAERRAQEQARERQRQQEEMEESQAMLQESLDNLGNAIMDLKQTVNSYGLVIHNTTKHPYKINLDGHILGVVAPYKTETYLVPVEWYGRLQAIQTSGYMFYPTVKDFKIPQQKKKANVSIKL